MDNKVYRIPEYHKMVLRFVQEETCKDLFGDMKSLIGDIVIATATGLAYAVWSYISQDTIIDWIGVVVSVISGVYYLGDYYFFCVTYGRYQQNYIAKRKHRLLFHRGKMLK
jgi:hypothetical protein